MRYQINRTQQLQTDIGTAWKFFSSPYNLSQITRKEMNFIVLNDLKVEYIYEGMIINYSVSPILNIPLKWQTKITQVDEGKSFTDFQQKGPYKYWNHHHEFISNEQGVIMNDKLDYELPLGVLGRFAHLLFVSKKLKYIFDYRFKVLEELFNHKRARI